MSDIARTLRADSSRAEAKRAGEKVAGWLGRWDFAGPLNRWLLGKASECASDAEAYAVDFSDISKEFGGGGMEGSTAVALGVVGSKSCRIARRRIILAAMFQKQRPIRMVFVFVV